MGGLTPRLSDPEAFRGGLEAEILGGPVFRMTGFVTGGPEDVIFSKPYVRTVNTLIENTLLELRHKPE